MSLGTYASAKAIGGGVFGPESIGWHSLFWAEGSEMAAEGYSDTDDVGTWPNEGGDNNATQATAGRLPTFTTLGINGHPSVTFNGARQNIRVASFASAPTYPITIVSVFRAGSDSGNTFLFDGVTGSTRNANFKNGASFTIFAGSSRSSPGVLTNGSDYIGLASFDGGGGGDTLTLNGTELSSSDAGSSQLTGLSIGIDNSSANGAAWDSHIALIGIYEGDFTADPEFSDFETWVTDHYGISIA